MRNLIFLFGVLPLTLCAKTFTGRSEMRDYTAQYQEDVNSLNRKYEIKESDEYYARFDRLYNDWLKKLNNIPFDGMSQDGKVDYVLLRNSIEKDVNKLSQNKIDYDQIRTAIPFADKVMQLVLQRRTGTPLNGEQTAKTFNEIRKNLQMTQKEIEKLPKYS